MLVSLGCNIYSSTLQIINSVNYAQGYQRTFRSEKHASPYDEVICHAIESNFSTSFVEIGA